MRSFNDGNTFLVASCPARSSLETAGCLALFLRLFAMLCCRNRNSRLRLDGVQGSDGLKTQQAYYQGGRCYQTTKENIVAYVSSKFRSEKRAFEPGILKDSLTRASVECLRTSKVKTWNFVSSNSKFRSEKRAFEPGILKDSLTRASVECLKTWNFVHSICIIHNSYFVHFPRPLSLRRKKMTFLELQRVRDIC